MKTNPVTSTTRSKLKSTSPCKILRYFCGFVLSLGSLALIIYGAYHLRSESQTMACTIPLDSHIHKDDFQLSAAFCNPSVENLESTKNLNFSFWCDQLGCHHYPPDEKCVLYVTGDLGSYALKCFASVPADRVKNWAMIAAGTIVFLIQSACWIWPCFCFSCTKSFASLLCCSKCCCCC